MVYFGFHPGFAYFDTAIPPMPTRLDELEDSVYINFSNVYIPKRVHTHYFSRKGVHTHHNINFEIDLPESCFYLFFYFGAPQAPPNAIFHHLI